MRVHSSIWPSLAQLLFIATTMTCGCSNTSVTEISSTPDTTLKLSDGTEIAPQSLRCIFRQATGASDELSLQLQYLRSPDRVAFAAYLTDPIPAMPFSATPRDVKRFAFEAFPDMAKGYQAELTGAEITVHLDELPQPSSLSDGAAVTLHGQLELAGFALPSTGDNSGNALHVAPGALAIDCNATFQRSTVLH